jgi:cell division GTPase FtsZ
MGSKTLLFKKLKNIKTKQQVMQNDINIDFTDYQTILLHKGKIDGLVSNCKVEDFMSSLSEDLKVSLKKAKGVVVEFEHHNDLSVSIIGSLVEELNAFIDINSDMIFGTKQNDTLQKNMIEFRLIVAGIEE